jgi:hypothetical protein
VLDIVDKGEIVAMLLLDAGVDMNSLGVDEITTLQLAALLGREGEIGATTPQIRDTPNIRVKDMTLTKLPSNPLLLSYRKRRSKFS